MIKAFSDPSSILDCLHISFPQVFTVTSIQMTHASVQCVSPLMMFVHICSDLQRDRTKHHGRGREASKKDMCTGMQKPHVTTLWESVSKYCEIHCNIDSKYFWYRVTRACVVRSHSSVVKVTTLSRAQCETFFSFLFFWPPHAR